MLMIKTERSLLLCMTRIDEDPNSSSLMIKSVLWDKYYTMNMHWGVIGIQ